MTAMLNVELQKDSLAIVKLEPGKTIPDWASAGAGEFVSITHTAEEVSIVCAANQVPDDVQAERGWTALKVIGPLSFDQVGIIASLASPLKQAGIPIFVISTFDTDYLLVKETDIDKAITVLTRAGHVLHGA